MNEQLLARAGAFAHLLPDRSPKPKVCKLVNQVRDLPPGILADVTRFKVFRAVLEWKYQHYSCTDKRLLCFDFGFPHAVSPEQVIERISTNLNTPSLDAVRVLGRYMGISPENVFSIFPVSERRQMICNSEPQECIPHALNLADGCYQLSHVERQYDFAGYVEQAICVYNNKDGDRFTLMATREMLQNNYGKKIPHLTIGHAPAFAYLLGRTDIDRRVGATVILPLSLDIAIELRALTTDSRVLQASHEFIISGLVGGSVAMKCTELSPLLYHRVILIPEFHREGLLAVDDVVSLCRKPGAAEVSIYPWPLFLKEPAHATTAWGEGFQGHGTRLDMEESPFLLLKKIEQDAVTPSDFHHILEEYGVLATEKNTHEASHPTAITVKHLNELKQGNVDEQQFLPDLGRMFSVGQISLLWGPSNSGKSLVAQTIALALASGSPAFSIKNSSGPRRVMLIDGELTEEELRSRVEQLASVHADFVEKNLLFSSMRGASVENSNIISDDFANELCKTVRDNDIQVVIIDNLITLASSATHGNDDTLFALIRNIERNGAAVIIVHHSTKRGDAFKGSSNLGSKSQNVIQVDGRDTLMADEELEAELMDALDSTDGAVVRLRWQKCKTAPVMEGKTFGFYLPLGGTWKSVSDEMEAVSSISVVSGADEASMPDDESRVMKLFSENRVQIKRRDVEACLRCGEDKAGTILNNLKKKGMIRAVGGGRSTAYRKA